MMTLDFEVIGNIAPPLAVVILPVTPSSKDPLICWVSEPYLAMCDMCAVLDARSVAPGVALNDVADLVGAMRSGSLRRRQKVSAPWTTYPVTGLADELRRVVVRAAEVDEATVEIARRRALSLAVELSGLIGPDPATVKMAPVDGQPVSPLSHLVTGEAKRAVARLLASLQDDL